MVKKSPTYNTLLLRERERRCWTQQELADKVGTTPLNIGRWEQGKTKPGPHFRQKLCEVFEKNVYELGLLSVKAEASTITIPDVSAGESSTISISQPALTASIWNVPYRRNLFFTGREDILAYIRTTFGETNHSIAQAQTQAISGLGGIGKTQTAIEYAYRYRDNYSSVFWVRADSHDLLTSDFLTISALLNLPESNEQDQNVVVKAVQRWFDSHDNWLFILDNADDIHMVEEFIPSSEKGHTLLTTRAQSTGTLAERIELEKMSINEGTFFLLHRAKRLKGAKTLEQVPVATRTQVQAIVEEVDGLPLALDQAGAYLEETGYSLTDYLKFYKKRRNRLLRTRGRDASGHPEPVATTWSLSFEKVEQTNLTAAELLRLCAFLHPDAIPEQMIIEGASELGDKLQVVVEDELDLNGAIGELLRYSLVKRDVEARTLNIHRLVQAVIKDRMQDDEEREWAERTVRVMNKVFPTQPFPVLDVASWPTSQQYVSHVQTVANLINHWRINSLESAQLIRRAGNYLVHRVQYLIAETLLRQALVVCEQMPDLNYAELANCLNDLGWLYYTEGKYELAEPLLKQALDTRELLFGPKHFEVAKNVSNLATLYMAQGRYALSAPLYQRAITIIEETQGPDSIVSTTILNNLAALYGRQGKYKEAEPFFHRVLLIREKVLGLNHPSVARSIYNLARVYRDQKKYEQVETLHRRALTIREQVLGLDHPDVAQSLDDLGLLFYDQNDHKQSIPLFERALLILEHAFGLNHPDITEVLVNLANANRELGEYEQAEKHFQRALSIGENSLEQKHPYIVAAIEGYATLLRKINREAEALELEARVQAIRAKQE
jgi:tetratricopeptide (TPR) repeat protein/transcriptional regulator with XRE-family HTH domain